VGEREGGRGGGRNGRRRGRKGGGMENLEVLALTDRDNVVDSHAIA